MAHGFGRHEQLTPNNELFKYDEEGKGRKKGPIVKPQNQQVYTYATDFCKILKSECKRCHSTSGSCLAKALKKVV